jgi:hypothetical protein
MFINTSLVVGGAEVLAAIACSGDALLLGERMCR